MAKTSFKKFLVRWGSDVCVELSVIKSDWQKIARGDSIGIEGTGYWYQGEWFQDTWYFSKGLDGDLEVCYEQPNESFSERQGFVGSPRDALIDEKDT